MILKVSLGAVLEEYGEATAVREIAVPELEPMAALVMTEAATLCGTDAHIHAGEMSFNARLPLVVGHEAVGRVVALGRERRVDALGRTLSVGDRVVWSYGWCGECYWCSIARQPTLCAKATRYGWGPADAFPYLTGGCAEYVYIQQKCPLLKVSHALDAAVVASTTCAFRTVVHGFDVLGVVRPHETVVVQGTGAVGLYAVAYALAAGAAQVFAFGAPENRLVIARAFGAHATFDVTSSSREERLEHLRDATDGRGADLVVECSGAAAALEEGVSILRRGGRYMVLGSSEPKPASIYGTDINLKQLTLVGARSGAIEHFYKAIHFVEAHQQRFDFKALLSSAYYLDQVTSAIADLRAGVEIKPVVLPRLSDSNLSVTRS